MAKKKAKPVRPVTRPGDPATLYWSQRVAKAQHAASEAREQARKAAVTRREAESELARFRAQSRKTIEELRARLRRLSKTTLVKRCQTLAGLRDKAESQAVRLLNEREQARRFLQSTEAALRTFKDLAGKEKDRADKAEDKSHDQLKKITTLETEVRSLRSQVASNKVTAEQIVAWEAARREGKELHNEASRENLELRRQRAQTKLAINEVIAGLEQISDQQATLAAVRLRKIVG